MRRTKETRRAVPGESAVARDTRQQWALLGLLALTALTYSGTASFGWVYDDIPQIAENGNLSWSHIGSFFSQHLWASSAGFDARYYRPMLQIWFLLNKSLFGLNPHWFHVTTVLAHVAATWLAFLVARTLLRSFGAALFVAAVFGVHPLHTETASWISDVNDSLAAIFALALFLAYVKATTVVRSKLWWGLAVLFLVLGLLVKEIFVVVPAIVLIHLLTSDGVAAGRKALASAIAAVAGILVAAYLIVRHLVIGSGSVGQLQPLSWATALFSAPYLFGRYLVKVATPWGLSPHYDIAVVTSPFSVQFLFGVFAILAVVVIATAAVRRWGGAAWTAVAWLVLPLLPALNVRWLNRGDYAHDRYLYLSLFGVALPIALALTDVRKKWPHAPAKMAAIVVVAGMAFASAVQSFYWANDPYLFGRGVQIAPQNEWAHLNYGAALYSKGKYAEAAVHFTRSYELAPGWRAAEYAGMAEQRANHRNAAEKWFSTAVEKNPKLAEAWLALAQIRLNGHQPLPAIEMVQRALQLQNDGMGYHYLLGQALEEAHQPEAALQAYEAELALYPQQVGARRAVERIKNSHAVEQ